MKPLESHAAAPGLPPGETVFSVLEAAGLTRGHYSSDLYAADCPDAVAIVQKAGQSFTRFRSEIDGERLLDLPFAYAPYWVRLMACERAPALHRLEVLPGGVGFIAWHWQDSSLRRFCVPLIQSDGGDPRLNGGRLFGLVIRPDGTAADAAQADSILARSGRFPAGATRGAEA